MSKVGLGLNVYDAAVERIKWTFDNFERVYLSFSAGKDSTVMMHMACKEARERGVKIGVLTGSLLSTIFGYLLLLISSKKVNVKA